MYGLPRQAGGGAQRHRSAARPRPAFIGPAGRAKGGVYKMQPTFGAELPAQGYVPAACEPTSKRRSMGGRAAWPTARHLAVSSGDLGARSIEIFQEAIQSEAESSPQVSRM